MSDVEMKDASQEQVNDQGPEVQDTVPAESSEQAVEQPAAEGTEAEEVPAFSPGDLVIAKVKGYPPWPAIVVTKDYLPDKIRESRPKSRITSPILFFNDNTYMWASETDLKILSIEEAAKKADKPKTKKALREAYRMASEKPTIDEYLESQLNPPVVEEPAPPAKKQSQRAKKAAELPASASRVSRASTKAIKRKLKDGGPADDADTSNSLIEIKRPKQRGRPSVGRESELADAEDLAASSELRAELCRQARLRLQEAFFVEDPKAANISSLNAVIDQIEQVESLEIALIRISKLHRVLRQIVGLDIDAAFKARCEKLLEKWNTPAEPIIRGLPEGEVNMDELRESETPMPSEAPEEAKSEAPEEEVKEESNGDDIKEENGANGSAGEPQSSGPPASEPQASEPATADSVLPAAPPSEAPEVAPVINN